MVKAERNTWAWESGDTAILLMTGGVYLLFKILQNKEANPWRCSVCGTRV
jgi:hypothetical protein